MTPHQKPPYAKYAFLNAYNLSLFGGALAAAAATGQWWIAAVTAGAEAIWMLFAPDSRLLQKAWFDAYHRAEQQKAREAEIAAKVAGLPPREGERFLGLRTMRDQIQLLARDNPALTQDLLRTELEKLDQLVMAFLDLATTSARYALYLRSVDMNHIEREGARFEELLARSAEPEQRELAQKNLLVLAKRRDMDGQIAGDLQIARGQLDLIENTFRLLADQIVTMRTPRELGGQLDELIQGVETARQAARQTEKIIAAIER